MNTGYDTFVSTRARQAAELTRAVPEIARAVDDAALAGALVGPGLAVVGIGASHAAAAAPVWALRARGIDAVRLAAGDLPLPMPAGTTPVIAVSQSGRSAETIAVLESVAPERRMTVVNAEPSPIGAVAGRVIGLGNLYDSYASTLGYTATVAALGMIADAWNGGVVDPGWSTIGRRVEELDAEIAERLPALVGPFRTAAYADFVGGGPSAGSAEAGALLFREVARVPSTGMSTRQYLHGSMESAGDGVHVVVGDERECELATTLARAGHSVVLVTTTDGHAPAGAGAGVVRLPVLPVAQRALLEAVVMQNLVGAAAAVLGVDIEEFVFHNSDTKVESAPVRSAEALQ